VYKGQNDKGRGSDTTDTLKKKDRAVDDNKRGVSFVCGARETLFLEPPARIPVRAEEGILRTVPDL